MADNHKQTGDKYTDEELLEYLRNDMQGEAANALEKQMLEDSFLDEAMQGLRKYDTASKISSDVHDINTKIRSQTGRKRILRRKTEKQPNWILYIAFIIIILLLIAYVVMQ